MGNSDLDEQIGLYLADKQTVKSLADWMALHAQELSDLPRDGKWEFQAAVWELIWQVEGGAIEESGFKRELEQIRLIF